MNRMKLDFQLQLCYSRLMKPIDSFDVSNEREYLEGIGRDNGTDLICYMCGGNPWWPHMVDVHGLSWDMIEGNTFIQKQRVLR